MRISFLGDSLTEGRPGESFFVRLRALLPGEELLNYGRAGDTVPALLARLERTALEPVDLTVVWIGVNDAFLGDWFLPKLDDSEVGGGATTAFSTLPLRARRWPSACHPCCPTPSSRTAFPSGSPALPLRSLPRRPTASRGRACSTWRRRSPPRRSSRAQDSPSMGST
jgi:hypothetical protein